MKILIPKFAEELEDDGVKLWLAFMLRMAKKSNGGFRGVRYYMHASDMRYFWRRWVIAPHKISDPIWHHIYLGKANSDIWMFEWKRKPESVEYNFTNPELCAIWGYVLGLDATSQLVQNHQQKEFYFPESENRVLTKPEDKHFFQYFGVDDTEE